MASAKMHSVHSGGDEQLSTFVATWSGTADPSAPLRFGMTKSKACFLVCICDREGEGLALNPQIQHSNRTDAIRSDDPMHKSKWEMARRIQSLRRRGPEVVPWHAGTGGMTNSEFVSSLH